MIKNMAEVRILGLTAVVFKESGCWAKDKERVG